MIDIIDIERIEGDLWIVCNEESILMVEDAKAVDLGEKLFDAAGAPHLKNARKALSNAGYCGEGNLAEMITRALSEAKQRGRDEMAELSNALIEASDAFPDEMVGTVAERAQTLVYERELFRKLLVEWAMAYDDYHDGKNKTMRYNLAVNNLFLHVCATYGPTLPHNKFRRATRK